MLQEKVLQYFRDNTHLRILFFFDPSGEYKEEFDKLEVENIVKVVYENNPFGLKWRLVDELKESKVLLYFDQDEPKRVSFDGIASREQSFIIGSSG